MNARSGQYTSATETTCRYASLDSDDSWRRTLVVKTDAEESALVLTATDSDLGSIFIDLDYTQAAAIAKQLIDWIASRVGVA